MARTASPVATASTATSCCSKRPPCQPWQTRMSSRALQRVSHGVSLIEVLVVVGLMALALALFSGVLGGGLDCLRLRNATTTLSAEELLLGKWCFSTCRSRVSPYIDNPRH